MADSPAYFEATHPYRRLAYRYTPPLQDFPTVVYLSGFRADMRGEKVLFLESLCQEKGIGFLVFDYFGHGQSSGQFEEGTISQWLDDSLQIIDRITQGAVILVGSSMGGWLAHLVTLRRPSRIVSLLGIAPAPDFTEDLLWQKFTQSQQDELMNQGWTLVPTEHNPNGWTITKKLIEDGRKHLLLGNPIAVTIPIRLIHGLKDMTVSASSSHQLAALVASQDVTLTLVKSGEHRLSREEDKQILWALLQDLVASYLLTKGG
ncbi:MAG: alpha/beta hydrolase [Alphaproteobacteria bacterium]|jgi:pimeloyl-ACP methyl ester carboxylesterase|nr:alpha/beta hydrolase [Alphaproteobacteria bacterium]